MHTLFRCDLFINNESKFLWITNPRIIMRFSFIILCFMVGISAPSFAQIDNTGPGHGIHFDGVDDYIDIGDVYDDITFPFTFSVWINVPANNTLSLPIFASQDDDALYDGFWLYVSPATILADFGDGRGENNINYRRGRQAAINQNIYGKWNHIAYVIRSESNVEMYLNGISLVTVPSSGLSTLPMDSNSPGHASIGRNKSSLQLQRFVGDMDEIRIFNFALSESQIRQQMCSKISATEPGLIGYWRFDEISGTVTKDYSQNGYNGQLIAGPTQQYSGAPIGDESTFVYAASWSGVVPIMTSGTTQITITDIQNNPGGAQIYKVNSPPSQTSGLGVVSPPYFGAFMAATDFSTTKNFRVNVSSMCDLSYRDDNTEANWTGVSASAANFVNRVEFVKANENNAGVEITGVDNGPVICDQKSVTLSAQTTPSGASIIWSTGETSSSINVSKSGTYSVKASENCNTATDKVEIEFLQSPSDFSLGGDLALCSVTPFDLKPVSNVSGLNFTWQDGSTDSLFHVSAFGTYWVTIGNQCGMHSDTLAISKTSLEPTYSLPNVITPNGDNFNQEFQVHSSLRGSTLLIYNRWGKLVYKSENYQNEWSGDNVASGTYYYRLHHFCLGEFKGWISVIR